MQDQGLLNTLLKSNMTIEGRCQLDAAGDIDESAGALVSPGTQNVLTLEEQITRTLAAVRTQADVANTPSASERRESGVMSVV